MTMLTQVYFLSNLLPVEGPFYSGQYVGCTIFLLKFNMKPKNVFVFNWWKFI